MLEDLEQLAACRRSRTIVDQVDQADLDRVTRSSSWGELAAKPLDAD